MARISSALTLRICSRLARQRSKTRRVPDRDPHPSTGTEIELQKARDRESERAPKREDPGGIPLGSRERGADACPSRMKIKSEIKQGHHPHREIGRGNLKGVKDHDQRGQVQDQKQGKIDLWENQAE